MEAIAELSTNWNGLFFGLFLLLTAAIALYARAIPQGGPRWWLLAGLTVALTAIGTLVNAGWGKTIFIDAAALAAVGLIFIDPNPQARRAAKVYLGMTAAAILCLLAAEFLAEKETPTLAVQKILVCLLLVGFALKLALLPLYFWLPGVAQHAAPMSVAVIISLVDIAAFTELAHFRQILPWVFRDYSGLWMSVALLSMFGGALLALKKMGVEWTPELLARIEETHRPFLDQHDQPRDASPQELSSNISLEYTPHGPRIKGAE